MKVAPPYPDYPYFRGNNTHFCSMTLCDLSVLAYGGMSQLSNRIGPFKYLGWVCAGDTQALAVEDDSEAAGGEIAIAFRGTEPYNVRDWATDFECKMNPSLGVHQGFLDAYRKVESEIIRHCEGRPRVFLTGHSLGAALATVAARFLVGNINLVTFGSPRVGNESFCSTVNRRCGTYCDRYVHGKDMVPDVPTEAMGYKHVGTPMELVQRPRPWANVLVPRPVFDHVPTLYGDSLWGD
jgi:hypothetical protein